MADIFTKRKRSAVLSAIRSRGNAATELRLVAVFRAHGITGWRRGASLQWKVEGLKLKKFRVKPDFVFGARRLAVFVDGCCWHGCPRHATPRHATPPKTKAVCWRKKEARQRVDGHDAGVAPQRSAAPS
jgi:DNA mismatch endonuclease (patch repair protein)